MKQFKRFLLTLAVLLSFSTVTIADDGPIAVNGRRIDVSGASASYSLEDRDKHDLNDINILDALGEASSTGVGVELFEEEIDNVIFATNEFLTDATFIGDDGPFWMIMQVCMCLGALFALIMAAGMAYKMMVKGEPFDVLKILRALGIATVMMCWYGNPMAGMRGMVADGYVFDGGVLDMLAYIPNCIGSYTHDLYEIEALQVEEKYRELTPLLAQRDSLQMEVESSSGSTNKMIHTQGSAEAAGNLSDAQTTTDAQKMSEKQSKQAALAGVMVAFDKILLFLSLVIYRIGWWATIFIQQIMLGMLTIFGPIQWAFSLLPKWEGAWAKWLTRYLTVHFYGAMLYFVGFYVLLLFDIVISIQIDQISQIVSAGVEGYISYIKDIFLTAGYLLVAAVVALKCLNLVPDLAAWMIPEGDTSFAARNFGEGVAQGAKAGAASVMK